MADSPLKRLARLLGGVALAQGRIPHQALGQMLIADSTSVEIAGANVVMAASSGQRDAMAQVALRTAAPALAVQSLAQRQERRLRRLAEQSLEQQRTREGQLATQREQIRVEQRNLDRNTAEQQQLLDTRERQLDARAAALEAAETRLQHDRARLREQRKRHREQLAQKQAEIERLQAELEQLRERCPPSSPPPSGEEPC